MTTERPYVVVSFLNEKKKGKQMVDLVPKSWLIDVNGNFATCYYPSQATDVDAFVKERKKPSLCWEKYKVEIMKRADSYEQGIRRLERAFAAADVESTAAEDSDAHSQVVDKTNNNDKNAAKTLNTLDETTDEGEGIISQSSLTKRILRRSRSFGRLSSEESAIESPDSEIDSDRIEKRREKKGKRSRSLDGETPIRTSGRDVSEILAAMERRLLKQMKGVKQSLQYDIKKYTNELKNTFIMHKVPTVGDNMKRNKETLGIKIPITEDATLIQFDEQLATDDEKETALKDFMTTLAGQVIEVREAVRKIVGGLVGKSVQELYSATGRPGANGLKKKAFNQTHVYTCMRDVILELLPGRSNTAAILTATSRYLSGVTDRDGGKKLREKKKSVEILQTFRKATVTSLYRLRKKTSTRNHVDVPKKHV